MSCDPAEPSIQQQLDTVRRVIATTPCEGLLPGLELYALGLQRKLEQGSQARGR